MENGGSPALAVTRTTTGPQPPVARAARPLVETATDQKDASQGGGHCLVDRCSSMLQLNQLGLLRLDIHLRPLHMPQARSRQVLRSQQQTRAMMPPPPPIAQGKAQGAFSFTGSIGDGLSLPMPATYYKTSSTAAISGSPRDQFCVRTRIISPLRYPLIIRTLTIYLSHAIGKLRSPNC